MAGLFDFLSSPQQSMQPDAAAAQQAREMAALQFRQQFLRSQAQRQTGFQPEPLSPEHRGRMQDLNNAMIGATGGGIASLPALNPLVTLAGILGGAYMGANYRTSPGSYRGGKEAEQPQAPYSDYFNYRSPY